MKGTLSAVCAGLALSWVAIAGAQGYGQPGQTSDQGMSHRSTKSSEVKLVGCLAQGTTPDSFVLNNVTTETNKKNKSGSNMGEQTGTSGTSGQTGEHQMGEQTNMSFDLVPGSSRIDLKKYVGQKVEIKGRVEPEQGGESGSMSGETGTSGQSGSMSGSETGSQSGQSGSMSGSQTGSQSGQSGSMSGQSGSMSGQSAGAVTHKVRVSSVKQLGSSCQ